LLDLLSTDRDTVDQSRLSALSDADWEALLATADRHRLAPLLHWRLTRDRSALRVPAAVASRLAAQFRRWTLRSLALQSELASVQRTLSAAGIPFAALKGSYLAYHAYPHPALRPLRDLDILVPRQHALRAFEALIRAGCTRPPEYGGGVREAMESMKHLPPLRSASGRVLIEVHTRLARPGGGSPHLKDMSEDTGLWCRLTHRDVGGETVAYLSPTDSLLHLIVHSAYDNRLNNGPLTLSDLAYLTQSCAIDWPAFWAAARAGGWMRGSLLLLRAAESHSGPMPVAWPGEGEDIDPIAGPAFAECLALMLRDREVLGSEAAGTALRKLFPSRKQMAALFPVSERSPRVCYWYAVHAWRITKRYVPAYWRQRRSPEAMATSDGLSRLVRWLDEERKAT